MQQKAACLPKALAPRQCRSYRTPAEPIGERLTCDELHGEKIDLAAASGGSMDFEDLANVRMTDLCGVPDLRRQTLAESNLGNFDCDTALELLIRCLVNDSHASFCDFPYNPKTIVQKISRLEKMFDGCW